MKNIVILTADELRHDYFKIKFSSQPDIRVLKTYCDTTRKLYDTSNTNYEDIENLHFTARHRAERDFFEEYVSSSKDFSRSQYIERGTINQPECVQEICEINPDLIVTYGCCIIEPKLISLFNGKIINVHLGLSPYYFGSGTNFHPFVNKELSAVGCTFLYMDEGVDTGAIIHQTRADIDACDSIHQVGNRLIKKMTHEFIELVKNFDKIEKKNSLTDKIGKTYRRRDCDSLSIHTAYKNIREGMCVEYLNHKKELDRAFPLIKQGFLC